MEWDKLLDYGLTAYSAYQSTNAAEDAADAKVQASESSTEFAKWVYEQNVELQKPYYDAGIATLPMLQARAGIKPNSGTAPTLQKIPRYDANQAAGIDNIYDYVSNLYIDGLGREGTQENIEGWVDKIASGQLDKTSVIDAFIGDANTTNVKVDSNKLQGIKNAIGVSQSTMAAPSTNYLNSYSSGGGSDNVFGSGEYQGTSSSTMGASSAFGSFSFNDIGDFIGGAVDEYGKTAATGFTVGGLPGAAIAVAGQYAYNALTEGEENNDGGWGSTSSEGGFGEGEGGFGGSDTGYDESGEGYE